jgi:polyvinyl alcohol dehydrogenase (cytochrome)
MIADEAKPHLEDGAQAGAAQVPAPAGAAVWSAPTIDAKRGVLYAATGASTTNLATPASDAIVALDLEDGKSRWVKQFPPTAGADMEFGASPILRTLPSGRQIIVTGEISGVIYGLDPDLAGEVLWQAKVGEGIGVSQWGAAADHRNLYVTGENRGSPQAALAGGLTALDMRTGTRRWYTAAPAPVCSWGERNCLHFEPEAVTVIPGIAFVGALDGHLRAYSTIDGRILWDFDTAREYQTVNGIAASGGSLDHGGATIVNGVVYVNSGGGAAHPGNVLLAFSVDGK